VIERVREGGFCQHCQVHSFPMHVVTFGDKSRAWLCTHCTDRIEAPALRAPKEESES
jgi:hypothetical protein